MLYFKKCTPKYSRLFKCPYIENFVGSGNRQALIQKRYSYIPCAPLNEALPSQNTYGTMMRSLTTRTRSANVDSHTIATV